MELFKERLVDSFIVFMIILFFVAFLAAMCANILWPLEVFLAALLMLAVGKWVHWQFIEPYYISKAEKEKKKL